MEILIDENSIKEIVSRLGKELTADYAGKNPLMVTILKGSMIFSSDLIRQMDTDIELDFMKVSSYGMSTVSSGKVNILQDTTADIRGRHVILVEDIVDTGYTLSALKECLLSREPASLKICSLLSKPSRREAEVDIDYLGLEIPDKFIVGYGLDFAEKYRNLPYIGVYEGGTV